MALGHFLGAFVNNACLRVESPKNLSLTLNPSRKAAVVALNWTF